MEIRVLRYFLAIAREGSITGAARVLHVTQPTLSKQLKELEDELGKQLIVRGSKHISLTEEGRLFRKRAQEIIDLVSKTEMEIGSAFVGGDVHIGCAETEGMRIIAKAIREIQKETPQVHFHLFSGNAPDVMERIDKGLLDFGVMLGGAHNFGGYDSLQLAHTDAGGLLMRKDSPLAARDVITPEDLQGIPLMTGRSEGMRREYAAWRGGDDGELTIVATYNLIFNAALLVEEGVGYAFCLDKLANTSEESVLCFRPFEPAFTAGLFLIWKKNQVFSKAAKKFLQQLK